MKSTIQWAPPYSLGLLLALAVAALAGYAILRWASGRPIAPARRVGLLAIRLAILALVGLIVLNPVRVDEAPGTVERPRVFYLLDASQSMAIGKGTTTRWEQVLGSIRDADPARDPRGGAQVSLFRFGSRLAGMAGDFLHPEAGEVSHPGAPGSAVAAEPPRREEAPPAPTDSDTLLVASLEGLTDRFGQAPPQAVVVFSDGRARDPDRADAIARAYGRMKVPIHVFPAGESGGGGDVAIVALVAPNQVRKSSRIAAQVFVRCFGYKGRRAELKIAGGPPGGQAESVLAQDAGRPGGWAEELFGVVRVGRSGPSDRGPDRSPARRSLDVEQRLRRRHGDRPHEDPRALPRRVVRAIHPAGGPVRLRPRRGPRRLFTAPGRADGGPGHRLHGRGGLRVVGRFHLPRGARTTEDRESPRSPRSSSPTTSSS